MRNMERRAIICLCCAGLLVLGLIIFATRFIIHGDEWASYPANQHIYSNGNLSTGAIYDRHGVLLAKNTDDGIFYSDDPEIRRSTVHVTGDPERSIANSAETSFQGKLVGYNLITGTYSSGNRKLYLTIDADICKKANAALGGMKGTVGVYNYETGDIICLVSSPNFDPKSPPEITDDDTSGIYVNRFFSASIVPGSIFKLVTTAAVIDTVKGMADWRYTCNGSNEYKGRTFNCTGVHGTEDFFGALANSCNGAYAELSGKVGPRTLQKYIEKFHLNEPLDVNGIQTKAGSFEIGDDDEIGLAWSGIGQSSDLINPCSFLTFIGAIAGDGQAATPRILTVIKNNLGISVAKYPTIHTDKMLSSETAQIIQKMMKNNVEKTYGTDNFPGLDIYAKSGTAELDNGNAPHSWFTGFIKNENCPYAFIVLVENGGQGSETAGRVANAVMQEIVKKEELPAEED